MLHNFPLAMFAYFGYHLPLAERLGLIAEAGFGSTALWYGREELEVRRGRPSAMLELCRSAGLQVLSVHAAYRGCSALWTPGGGGEIMDGYRRALEFCAEAGAGSLVCHVISGREPPAPGPAGLDFFHALLDLTKGLPVSLALENTRSPGHLEFLLEHIDHPRLGLCYDSSHDFIYGRPPLELLGRHGRRLKTVHLADNDGRGDRHWLPGLGSGNIPAVLKLLAGLSASGAPLVLEIVPRDRRQAPARFLAQARAWADAALSTGDRGLS